MSEQQLVQPHALNVNPGVLDSLLGPRSSVFLEANERQEGRTRVVNPYLSYDAELLNCRLASIPLPNIATYDLRRLADQVFNWQKDQAFGYGVGGTLREVFTGKKHKAVPFTAPLAKFESPGEVWVLTADNMQVAIDGETIVYSFMPLDNALRNIERERLRRRLTPDMSPMFEVKEVRLLPKSIADYTRALQSATGRGVAVGQHVDVQAFRNSYFNSDLQNSDLTGTFKTIKQEYLGNTNWGTVLLMESLMRAADYGIGLIPGVGFAWDVLQGATGKELPLPFIEGLVRRQLFNRNTPLPESMFDKPVTSRLIELVGSMTALLPLLHLPGWLAQVPLDALVEGAVHLSKMQQTGKYLKPFSEIATDTGTKPPVIEKIEKVWKPK